MAVKILVYIATSLDGFIARENGNIDWLPAIEDSGEDYGYKEFISSIDLIVMGRHTYEKALTFENWPYPNNKVIILSTGTLRLPEELADKVEVQNQSPLDVYKTLAMKGAERVYLDGGKTIQLFMKEGLVDEMTITAIPVLIGKGLSLFGPLKHDLKFQLVESKTFNNGFVQTKYKSMN